MVAAVAELLMFKLGHCEIQFRPLGVKTGQYPTVAEPGEGPRPCTNRFADDNCQIAWRIDIEQFAD
jgi:hypothetical protein